MTEEVSRQILLMHQQGLTNEVIGNIVRYAPTTVKREIETKVLVEDVVMHRLDLERIEMEKNMVKAEHPEWKDTKEIINGKAMSNITWRFGEHYNIHESYKI